MHRFRQIILTVVLTVLLVPAQVLAAPRLQDTEDKVVIVIDPGHGGENLGTIENNHLEKEMTLVTALAMYEELLQYDNVEIYLTRTEDKDMSLRERAQFAQSVNADFLFSIHYNASENHELYGSEVWVPLKPPLNGYGYQFGYELLTDMRDAGLLVRGVKTRLGEEGLDYYGILREASSREIPAVIIEHCHVDEAHDAVFCDSDEKLKAFGKMDALAAAKYFGLKSSSLGLDFTDYSLAEADGDAAMPITLNTKTSPEMCHLEYLDADYQEMTLTLSVSAIDSDSPLLYYSYSLDGGETFSTREPWPGSDALNGTYDQNFTLTLDIQPGTCPEVVLRAYNNYDLCTESNHYESIWVYPDPEEETAAAEPETESSEEKRPSASVLDENRNLVIIIVLFTAAVIFSMILVVQVLSARRRKKRKSFRELYGQEYFRQPRNEED